MKYVIYKGFPYRNLDFCNAALAQEQHPCVARLGPREDAKATHALSRTILLPTAA